MAKKYWETETPKEVWGEKSVSKVYVENGKIQVYPRIKNTAHGIGRGATMDLETMTPEQLEEFRTLVNEAVDYQLQSIKEEIGV